MRLRKTPTGHVCASDDRISFERIHQADFPGSQRRTGWLVRVFRGGRRRPEEYLAKTLAEATAWARPRWAPDFLWQVRRALPDSLAHLYRQAIDDGDLTTFCAMLDAAQEAGATLWWPGSLIATARAELLLPKDLPITVVERQEARFDALAVARYVIEREARNAHEKNFSSRRGTNLYPRQQLLIYFDNNPFADRTKRPRILGLARARLKRMGVEFLAEAQYPTDGEGAGYTVALAFHPVDEDNLEQVREVLQDTWMEVVTTAS